MDMMTKLIYSKSYWTENQDGQNTFKLGWALVELEKVLHQCGANDDPMYPKEFFLPLHTMDGETSRSLPIEVIEATIGLEWSIVQNYGLARPIPAVIFHKQGSNGVNNCKIPQHPQHIQSANKAAIQPLAALPLLSASWDHWSAGDSGKSYLELAALHTHQQAAARKGSQAIHRDKIYTTEKGIKMQNCKVTKFMPTIIDFVGAQAFQFGMSNNLDFKFFIKSTWNMVYPFLSPGIIQQLPP
ncbi:hypothetical protein BT96DRAFT_945544 [Gymnopus androsaceus JB14]|uniref:Uncharacterized protein n=1 Tax=Gymnopus androsaceus JB14 TaxID=1447944 RepID=A0A6A4H0M5_9AGAR|nr:hypothetical protein BT96DRAFT_945544 [Gymnopus androsaceus JB14]